MSTKRKRITVSISAALFVVTSYVAFLNPAFAIDFNGCEVYDTSGNCLDNFYIQNGIDYDPSIPVCTLDGTPLGESDEEKEVEIGAELDYQGRTILNTQQIAAIKQNQPVYEEAAEEVGLPWQLLAALHFKTTGLKVENPSNEEGVYQYPANETTVTTVYPAGLIDKQEFLEQTKTAAEFLKGSTPTLKSDIKEIEPVKEALYRYLVGSDTIYSTQAKDLGFDNAYDGSPEIVNKIDEKRDSTKKDTSTTWGEYDDESKKLTYPASHTYGAYLVYATISGISLANCGGLVSGGMNLEQAQEFMQTYLKIDQGDPSGDRQYTAGYQVCQSLTDNCVTFSAYFVNKYTSLNAANVNGGVVVETMQSKNPDMPIGREPRPYAVFSVKKGVTLCEGGIPCGHTGIVLGVNKEENTIIIGEAAWCKPGFTGAHVYNLSAWTDTAYVYAYTDDYIKKDQLQP